MKDSRKALFIAIAAALIVAILATYFITKEVVKNSTEKSVEQSMVLAIGTFNPSADEIEESPEGTTYGTIRPGVVKVGETQIYDPDGSLAAKVPKGTKIACICRDLNDGTDTLDLVDWYPYID